MWLFSFVAPSASLACSFNDSFAYSSITPTNTYQVVNLVYSGERYQFTATAGMVYVFSYCEGGGTNDEDTQLQIFDLSGNSYAYNDDHCGLGSEVTWLCPAGGTYVVVTYEYNCNAYNSNVGDMAYKVMPNPTDQDCLGAIPLCFDTYSQSVSYSGTGNYPNEITTSGSCPSNCLLSGERNDVWYTFTTQTSGVVAFLISPNNSSDDYDWAVYNLTNNDCADIYSNSSIMVSCNYSGDSGNTGPNGGSSSSCGSASAGAYNQTISVSSGQTYVVNVSNYSSTQNGYSINFGGSTAQIIDDSNPFLQSIVYAPVCGQSNITVQFSENILCASLDANDFTVTGPNGTYVVSNVNSPSCSAGGSYDDIFTLEMSDILVDGGTYTVQLNTANVVEDICYNQAVNAGNLTFSFTGLTASASVFQGVTCYGDSNGEASASVSGGITPYFYTWTSGETGDMAYSLAPGTNYVTVTDFYGCEDVISVSIPEPPEILVNAGVDAPVCGGESIIIGGSPTIQNGVDPLSYAWSPVTGLDDPSSLNPAASPMVATTYTITVQDDNGCTGSDEISISLYPIASVNLVDDFSICTSATPIMLDAGAGYTNYDWSDNAYDGDQTMPVSSTDTYSVTVTNSDGCTATDMVTVTVNQNPIVNLGNSGFVCDYDFPFTLNAGSGFDNYDWTGTTWDGNQYFDVTEAGLYSVTVTDTYGCTGSNEISIDIDPEILITLVPTDPLCYGTASGSIQTVVTGGTPTYEYLWSNSQSTSGIANIVVGDYSVTVTDVYGCTNSSQYIMTEPSPILVEAEVKNVLCRGGDEGEITLLVSGGINPYVYEWSVDNMTSSHISNLEAGTYIVTITDLNNCEEQEVYVVTEPDKVISMSLIVQDVQCYNQPTGAALVEGDGGTPPLVVMWYENGTLIATGEEITSMPAGEYSVILRDDNNCEAISYFSVSEPSKLELEYSITGASCRGNDDGSAVVFAQGGTYPYQFEWTTGDITEMVEFLIAGQYTVTVTDANNCFETISMYITESNQLCLRIPNAFTPNADGVNDTWEIEYIEKYPSSKIFVFNRWGQEMYVGKPGDEPWDGTIDGNKAPAGAYTYVIDLRNGIDPFTGVVVIVY